MPAATTTQDLMFLAMRARTLTDADARLGVIDMLAPPGATTPLQVHHNDDEAFYVTEGELTVSLPGRETRLGCGDFLLAPHGVPHSLRVGPAGARFLVMSPSAGFVEFVREVAALDVPDPGRFAVIAAAYDISIVGPPGVLPPCDP